MMEATIFNIQRYSIHDGGGIRSIVFFKGCPFSCPWCCNPESLSPQPQEFYKKSLCMNCSLKIDGRCQTLPEDCPTGAKSIIGKKMSIDKILDIVKRDKVFYETSEGGVTLSGGEFLLQQEAACELLGRCRNEGINTAVETTLGLPIKDVERLTGLVDTFLVDMKFIDKDKAKAICHLDVELVEQNIKSVVRSGGHVIIRIPLIPSYTATNENLSGIIRWMKDNKLDEAHLLPFHQLGEGKYEAVDREYDCHELKPLSDERIAEIEKMFEEKEIKTIIGGN